MNLYTCSAGPRRQLFYVASQAPASAYTLLQQLLTAYNEVLYTWWEPEPLYLACFGDYATRPTKRGHAPSAGAIAKRTQALEDRLGYEVPELLERMSPEELQQALPVFCRLPLPGFVQYVLAQERTIQHRLREHERATARLNDDSHAKAAGLWKSYARPVRKPAPAPLPPSVKPTPQRATKPARAQQLGLWPPVETTRPLPAPTLRSARRSTPAYNPHHHEQLWLWPARELLAVAQQPVLA